PLHAHANPQEWLSAGERIQQRQAQLMIERQTAIEVPHTRDNQLFRLRNHLRIASDFCRGAQMLKSLFDRANIAGSIIDNRDHRSPLVLGSILANCLSREQATRTARAKALNRASILWWLERP